MRPLAAVAALALALTGCGAPIEAPDVLALATCDVAPAAARGAPDGYLYRVDILGPGYARRIGEGCGSWDDSPCRVLAEGEGVEVGATWSDDTGAAAVQATLWLVGEAPACGDVPFDPAWLD